MSDQVLVSYTTIQAWKRCKRYFWFSSKFHQNLQPLEESAPLQFGRTFHEALAKYHTDKIIGEEMDNLPEDDIVLAVNMIANYDKWWQKERGLLPWKTLAVEYPFAVRVPAAPGAPTDGEGLVWDGKPVYYYGFIDLLLMENDNLIVVDHKTCSSFKSGRGLELDEQMTGYLWAMSQLEPDAVVNTAFYDEIRKVAPTKPKLLASGKLSTDKRQLVTHEMFQKAIKDNELEESDYQEYLDYLAERPDPFIRRTEVHRSKQALDNYSQQLAKEVYDMLSEKSFYPSPSWTNCNICAFYEPCVGMNEGDDWEFMLKELYTERKAQEVELVG